MGRKRPYEFVLGTEAGRHFYAEDERIAAWKEMRGLSLVGWSWAEPVVRPNRRVDLFLPIPVHVPEQKVFGAVSVLLPAFVARSDVLPAVVGERLSSDERRSHHK